MHGLQYRNELKHVICNADALLIRRRLSHILCIDPHAGTDGTYHVRSLYFDTPEDKALHDKLDGVPLREKFRIRLYNHDPRLVRLEKKIKCYGKSAKLTASLTREEVQQIVAGDIAFMSESDQALVREFYIKLKTERLLPKNVVDYMRAAYLCPAGNVRVTLDCDIRASVGPLDMFDAGLPTAPALDSGKCILEVKFDGFLPEYIQGLVQLNKCSTTAASKYAACRIYM